jgi:hypothetical protein
MNGCGKSTSFND